MRVALNLGGLVEEHLQYIKELVCFNNNSDTIRFIILEHRRMMKDRQEIKQK